MRSPRSTDRDGPRDECGVFGVYAPEHDVARLAYFALYALQHRGQESAGIAAAARGGNIIAIRDQGLVSQVFDEHNLRSLGGELAIGHVRYSTTGSSDVGELAADRPRRAAHRSRLAHNGNLINAVELHAELRGRGVDFRSTSDSEIIAALIASHAAERIEDAVADVLPRLQGAFSTVVMTKDAVVAFRDPHGLRPLVLGRDRGPRPAAARLLRRQRVVRVRPHRRRVPARRAPGRGRLARASTGSRPIQVVERRAPGVLRLRVHLLRAPGLAHGGTVLQVARGADGRDPLARGARRGRSRDPGAGLRQRRRARATPAPPGCPRTTASSRTATSRGRSSSPARSCAGTACG